MPNSTTVLMKLTDQPAPRSITSKCSSSRIIPSSHPLLACPFSHLFVHDYLILPGSCSALTSTASGNESGHLLNTLAFPPAHAYRYVREATQYSTVQHSHINAQMQPPVPYNAQPVQPAQFKEALALYRAVIQWLHRS